MSEQPDPAAEAARWIVKADHDLLAAEHSIGLADEGLTDIVCYHCQQAAEKYLGTLKGTSLIFLLLPSRSPAIGRHFWRSLHRKRPAAANNQ